MNPPSGFNSSQLRATEQTNFASMELQSEKINLRWTQFMSGHVINNMNFHNYDEINYNLLSGFCFDGDLLTGFSTLCEEYQKHNLSKHS